MIQHVSSGEYFGKLFSAISSKDALSSAYGCFLSELFSNEYWDQGKMDLRRVLWTDGHRARKEDGGTFGSPGLYIWGGERRPLYIGITGKSFKKRFSRYIWQKRSQCNLASLYEPMLIENDIDGFPVEISQWYAKNAGKSTVRLRGAARFAKEGITKVWFALLPHSNVPEIKRLEQELVPVAEGWNLLQGYSPLLNIEFNRRKTGATVSPT